MLLLDSEALSAVAHGPRARRDRVRALVGEMRRRDLPVATVSVVLAEVVRGRAQDAAIFGTLHRERVLVRGVDMPVAVRAGRLLGKARFASDHAIDAFVVAVADLEGGALIATVDTDDLEVLAEHATNVSVASIQPTSDDD